MSKSTSHVASDRGTGSSVSKSTTPSGSTDGSESVMPGCSLGQSREITNGVSGVSNGRTSTVSAAMPIRISPAGRPPVTALQRMKWLRDMMLIREFELRTMQAYQEAKIGGFCHVYIGQEAVAVGCVAALQPDDPVVTAYRDHGHGLACGMEARYAMAEMFGKVTGCAKGKGGSMHFFDKRNHMYGGHAIVGGQAPLGVGLAFATKYENEVLGKGSPRVSLAFFGDGALNQGALHEAMNLASVLAVPCIFCLENNGYSMGTSIERGTSAAHNLAAKAAAYDMPAYEIDAMDVMNVYHGMKAAADWSREHQKPAFVDLKTYRYKGHSMSDPQKYRTKEEVTTYEGHDPIQKLSNMLFAEGAMNEQQYQEMAASVKAEVRDAVKFAEESPFPDVSAELYSDIYSEPYGHFTSTPLPEMMNQPGRRAQW